MCAQSIESTLCGFQRLVEHGGNEVWTKLAIAKAVAWSGL